MQRKSPRVLVLGKTGMLGAAVFKRLAGHEGWVVDGTQRSDHAKPLYFDAYQGVAGLKDILSRNRYNYIINCIGVLQSSIDERDPGSVRCAITVNGLFPYLLAQAASEISARVIHISTDGVFSGRSPAPYLEDSPLDCIDHYGRTKALGECPAENFINIRCSIIGRDAAGKNGLLEWFLGIAAGETVTGYQDCLWNGVSTGQFARLCEAIIREDRFVQLRSESHVFHFCPNQPVSKYELLCLFKKVTGKRININKGDLGKAAYSRILGTSFKALKSLYEERMNWEEIIREVIEENGKASGK